MRRILCSGLLIVFIASCKRAEPAVYLIPQDYNGVVAVVYSQKIGSEEKIVNGRRQFIIPKNGILFTQMGFSDGGRNDLFLIKTVSGYDTLKSYLPNKDTTGKKFGGDYYKIYTNDSNQVAVNFRQIINLSLPSKQSGKSCNFEYELITIGRAATLNDSTGKIFAERLDIYLQDSICN